MMKHQYRSRNDIIASILEVANGNRVRATEIQFKAYISYSILKEYLVLLLNVEGERTFKTAPKGMHFLHTHSQMGELITVTNAVPKKPVNEFLI